MATFQDFLRYGLILNLNILSFTDARQRFRVTVDTAVESAVCVLVDDGKVLKFVEVESGLYLLKTNSSDTKKKISAYYFFTLVKANQSNFIKGQLARADKARELRKKIGCPGYKQYFKLLEKNTFEIVHWRWMMQKKGLIYIYMAQI